ncbi:hypothetical protein [Actinomyces faecalis]|uniref:hypothetical protein n=1 Tax=Actinomyces faecalis TaxID=2722820 RepID=UPI001555B72E|nr:hypothetical protein [Actinomyces faecalis]
MNREDFALQVELERRDTADHDGHDEREEWWADDDEDYERWRDQRDELKEGQ